MKPQAFIFIGRSGSGKGTQVDLLQEYLQKNDDRKILHITTGQLLRDFIQRDTTSYTAKLTKRVMDEAKLMPTFIPIWLWTGFLAENFTGEEHLFFDGLPRRMREVKILETAIEFYNIHKTHIVHVDISDEEARKRLLGRGRGDDTEEGIKSRLEWFKNDVEPILDFYKNHPNRDYHDINGEQSIEDVHKEIVKEVLGHE